ncbi:hypothetical protein [Fibrobacter sp. UWB5]|uniref:hypothetical protein n=1 Tax=Fibrobacter sp. UWB5 TaxID=1964360 RepID=UPI001185BD55|nr:hypothetical protein [Fibrobacter sp. UWB5]
MKKLGLALSLTAAFGLMACGDSSSSASGGTPSCNVSSDANSVTRSMSYGGETVEVKQTIEGDYLITASTYKGMPKEAVEEECQEAKYDINAEVTCEGNTVTTKVEAAGVTVAKLKSLAEGMCKDISSGVNMDDEEEDDYTPSKNDIHDNGGNSNPIDNPIDDPVTDPDPKTDVNNPMGSYNQPCSVEGEKKIDVVFGMEAPLICKDGFWDADEDAMEQNLMCSVEGATKDTVIAGIAMTLTCDEGEWTMDEASAEEMLKCDQEGAKSVVMGLPVICKDGQWDLDEDSMDWGDYGDWGDEEIIVD